MGISYQDFLQKTKAERVVGQLIVGTKGDRKIVGTYKAGVFTITEEGKAYLASMAAPAPVVEEKPKRSRKKAEEVVEVDDDLEKLLTED
jgi:hypothetical protein